MPGKTGKRRTMRFRKEKKFGRGEASGAAGRQAGGYGGLERESLTYEKNSVLRKYLEPDGEREREIQKRKKEIMAARQARKERNIRERKEVAASGVT